MRILGLLVVDGIGAALAGAFALIGAVGDHEKCDSDDGKDSEENERNHQVLPRPEPVDGVRVGRAEPLLVMRCRLRVCSRLKA